ncbi:MAG: hypothetical protein ABJA34_09010 [Pseudonocardiales bacterium]
MRKAVRDYLAIANSVAEVPRRRVLAAAKALAAQGEATAGQVSSLTEELLETSRSNREALANLVRFEVDRALGRVGLATSEEVTALSRRLATLEAERRAPSSTAKSPVRSPAKTAVKKAPTKMAPAKSAAKKAAAKSASKPAGRGGA